MPKRVTFEGKVHEFPDNATDAEIASALRSFAAPEAAPGPSTGWGLQPYESARLQSENQPLAYLGEMASNIPASAGRALRDVALGVVGLGKQVVQAPLQTYAAVRDGAPAESVDLLRTVTGFVPGVIQMANDRYGTSEARARTVRDDPIGMLADVSTLAGVGAEMAGARMPKIAAGLNRVERATNPLAAPGAVARRFAEPVSDAIITSTVRPSAALRREVGANGRPIGATGIARAIKQERVTHSEAAAGKLDATERRINLALEKADPVPLGHVMERLNEEMMAPRATLSKRETLGYSGLIEDADARFGNVYSNLLSNYADPSDLIEWGARPSAVPPPPARPIGFGSDSAMPVADTFVPAASDPVSSIDYLLQRTEVPLRDLNALKRAAQDKAYSHPARSSAVDELVDAALARGLRRTVDIASPKVERLNRQSQRLLWAKRALEAAEDRPSSLTNTLGTMTSVGGAVGTGNPLGALAGLPIWALDNPRFGARAGILTSDLGNLGRNATAQRAVLIARLAEETGLSPEVVEAALNSEAPPK